MSGSAPVVTLDPPSVECNAGDTITVVVAAADADTHTEVVRGTNDLGVPTVVSSTSTDTATVTMARFAASGTLARVSGMTVTAVATYGAGNLEITVQDAEGNETIATCKVTVRAPSPAMLIGSDRPGVQVGMFPGMTYFRAYSGPTEGIKPLPKPRGLLYHMSIKDTLSSATLDAWCKALPTDLAVPNWAAPFDVLWEFGHECEGDRTAAAQLAGVKLMMARAKAWNDAHPKGPRIGTVQTFTGFAQRHNTAKNAMTDGTASTIDNLWCGADILGVDIEKDTTAFPTGRPDHAALMGWIPAKAATMKNAAGKVGVPWIIPEFGWMPPNDAELAAWYTNGIAWLRKNGCAAVGVYDTNGSTANYVLSGAPLTAVQAAIAGKVG